MSILDALNLGQEIPRPSRITNYTAPEVRYTNPAQLRAGLEQAIPFSSYGRLLTENINQLSEQARIPYFDTSAGRTPASQFARGVANIPAGAYNLFMDATGLAAAPLAAATDRAFSPTYQTYLDETIMPIAEDIVAQQSASRAQSEKEAFMKERMRRGDPAFGPTYEQTPTPQDQGSALIARENEARGISDDMGSVSIMPDDSLRGGNIFEAIAGLTSDPYAIQEKLGQSISPDAIAAARQREAGQLKEEVEAQAGQQEPGRKGTIVSDVTDITDQPDDLVETQASGDVEGVDLGTGTDESAAETAFKSGYDAYLEALGESKDIGSIEDYKKEFADATGIDISGKVDNSSALMAFGLALMQNKAGKGFNVGNILSSVGAAGEAAQPLMAQAKKEARAGQLAGGKYALEQRKAAKANRQALMEAERDRVNELIKTEADFENQKELKRLQGRIDAGIERVKAENAAAAAAAKGVDTHLDKTESFSLFQDAPDVFKVNAFTENPNLPDGVEAKLKLTKASVAKLGPQFEASERALQKAEDELVRLTDIVANENITTQAQIGSYLASFGRGFGINTDSELSPVAQAKIILRRIATEEAPAILGEAGKTISDADRERVTDIVGDIGLLADADPQVILNKLQNVYKTVVEKGRNNLDTAYNVLHESGYDYGPYNQEKQQQQPTGMEVGETRDMGGVSVKRTG